MNRNTQSPLEAAAVSSPLIVIAAIADASAVTILLLTDRVQSWLAKHTTVATVAAGVSILIVVALLNRMAVARSNARESSERASKADISAQRSRVEATRCASIEGDLRMEVARLRERNSELEAKFSIPSDRDVERFKRFAEFYGPGSPLIKWVRSDYVVEWAYSQELRMIDKLASEWKEDPTTFREEELAKSFEQLKASFLLWKDKVSEHYYIRTGVPDLFGVPPEWEDLQPERHHKAMEELLETSTAFVDKYDEFMCVAAIKNLI